MGATTIGAHHSVGCYYLLAQQQVQLSLELVTIGEGNRPWRTNAEGLCILCQHNAELLPLHRLNDPIKHTWVVRCDVTLWLADSGTATVLVPTGGEVGVATDAEGSMGGGAGVAIGVGPETETLCTKGSHCVAIARTSIAGHG